MSVNVSVFPPHFLLRASDFVQNIVAVKIKKDNFFLLYMMNGNISA